MIELTVAEQNRLGSFKEQLASIKRNISSANSELETILVNKSLAETAFAVGQKKLNLEVEKLIKQKTELIEFIDSETKAITSEKKLLAKHIEEFEEHKSKEEWLIFSKYEEADEILEESKMELESLNNRIAIAKSDVVDVEKLLLNKSDILAGLEKQISAENRMLTLYKKDVVRLEKEREEAIKLTSKEIARVQRELSDAVKIVNEEKDKVRIPRESLRSEQDDFEKQKNQLLVIYNRTKKAWAQIYPGQNLDNVIKI
jgi:chromosome segregation ATPase